ncbi:hypothetical protein FH972_023884 [Carpinus fangiana]|uniref:2,4-dienoyl-CoA reductase [(3E)-enoyl-CoA-producing] n=1 Tax=Carpinus fangiana TaxID=176857 RepID=A0A5N6KWH4_9ROSI|nr:hypothetical protein FH972_023884 [Carpinus fangiana]
MHTVSRCRLTYTAATNGAPLCSGTRTPGTEIIILPSDCLACEYKSFSAVWEERLCAARDQLDATRQLLRDLDRDSECAIANDDDWNCCEDVDFADESLFSDHEITSTGSSSDDNDSQDDADDDTDWFSFTSSRTTNVRNASAWEAHAMINENRRGPKLDSRTDPLRARLINEEKAATQKLADVREDYEKERISRWKGYRKTKTAVAKEPGRRRCGPSMLSQVVNAADLPSHRSSSVTGSLRAARAETEKRKKMHRRPEHERESSPEEPVRRRKIALVTQEPAATPKRPTPQRSFSYSHAELPPPTRASQPFLSLSPKKPQRKPARRKPPPEPPRRKPPKETSVKAEQHTQKRMAPLPSHAYVSPVWAPGIFADKVVFCTGGAGSICSAQVRALVHLGANAFIIGRNEEKTRTVAADMQAAARADGRANAKVIGLGGVDVRRIEALEGAVAECVRQLGQVDFVIAGAAGNFLAPQTQLSANAFRAVVEIDLLGSYNTFKAALPELVKAAARNRTTGAGPGTATGGRIVFVSATLYYAGTPLQTHASAAKAGVDALSNHIAIEQAPLGVTSNVIAPGPISGTEGMDRLLLGGDAARVAANKSVPVGRFGTVREIADATVYLFSAAGNFVNGTTLVVDGGAWRTSGGMGRLQYPDFLLEGREVEGVKGLSESSSSLETPLVCGRRGLFGDDTPRAGIASTGCSVVPRRVLPWEMPLGKGVLTMLEVRDDILAGITGARPLDMVELMDARDVSDAVRPVPFNWALFMKPSGPLTAGMVRVLPSSSDLSLRMPLAIFCSMTLAAASPSNLPDSAFATLAELSGGTGGTPAGRSMALLEAVAEWPNSGRAVCELRDSVLLKPRGCRALGLFGTSDSSRRCDVTLCARMACASCREIRLCLELGMEGDLSEGEDISAETSFVSPRETRAEGPWASWVAEQSASARLQRSRWDLRSAMLELCGWPVNSGCPRAQLPLAACRSACAPTRPRGATEEDSNVPRGPWWARVVDLRQKARLATSQRPEQGDACAKVTGTW